MRKKYDCLLFDLDNTLLNFDKSSEEAFHHLITNHSDLDSHPDLYKEYSKVNHELWEMREQGLITAAALKEKRWALFFEKVKLKGLEAEEANRLYFEHIASSVHFVPFAKELLDALKAHFRLILVTNGLSEVQRPRLANAGLTEYFEHIIISDEISCAKPQQAFFDYSHTKMNFPDKERVLVIGDTLKSDIRGARAFGYKTCWFNHDGLLNEGSDQPDFEIRKLEELLAFVMV